MVDETPLQRLQREYEQTALPPAARDRIWRRVGERTPTASVRWTAALAVGVAAGCAVAAGWFWFESGNRSRAMPGAIALDVRGVVESQAEYANRLSRVSPKQRIPSGAWLETRQAASLQIGIGAHRANLGGGTRIKVDSLRHDRLAFSLAKGMVEFDVDPLPQGGTLSVRSGELVVEVVGTAFSVERNDACSILTVTEGRVRTTFRGRVGSVQAGQAERYCGNEAPAASSEAPAASSEAPAPPAAPIASSEPSFPIVSSRQDTANPAPASAASRSLTQEEQGFRRGIDALKSGASAEARQRFEEYLQTYPGGTFSQDARFHLIRLVYGVGETTRTVALGRQFLEQQGDHGARSDEVRLLVAQSLLRHGNAADEAFALLAPLVGGAEGPRGTYAEQTVYLYILAASRSGRDGEAHTWAKQYARRYPTGRYAEEVAKIASP